MRLIQFQIPDRGRRVGWVEGERAYDLTARFPAWVSIYQVFQEAHAQGRTLEEQILALCPREALTALDYAALWGRRPGDSKGWLLPPLDHPDPAHCLIGGTGLTHLGSMAQRDAMHKGGEVPKTDSQKMFEMGLEGGRPAPGQRGILPECFYKGSGVILRGHHHYLDIPAYAMDCGEEPEIVGCYVIGEDGRPYRLGFAIGNEWADHAMERVNYLWLAPSKMQNCAIGPELITDQAFQDIRGACRIHRNGRVIYDSGELLTGEMHMSHSLANLEDHHFKHAQFRVPGNVQFYFFGTMKLSFGHRDRLQDGDLVEIAFEGVGAPLANPVRVLGDEGKPIKVLKG
jgi:hypothetical protein